MKYLLFFLSFLVSGGNALNNCNTHLEFNYKLPDGLHVVRESQEDGFLSVVDKDNNGLEVEVRTKDLSIKLPETEAIGRKDYGDGSYRLNFVGVGLVDPFNAIVVVPKDNFVIYTYFYETGQSQAHSVFEEKAMQLVRSIAPGGNDEKVWKSCLSSVLCANWSGQLREGQSADVHAVSVR